MAVKKIDKFNIHENPSTNTNSFDVENYLSKNFEKTLEVVNNNADELVNLQTDNISNKEDITEIKVEQELQNNNIEKIQLENKELKAENERLREDLNNVAVVGQASGENITINDSSEARFEELKISGNSWQETRSGKNKFDLDKVTASIQKNKTGIKLKNLWAQTVMTNENLIKDIKPSTAYKYSAKVKVISKPTTLSSANGNNILTLYNPTTKINKAILYSSNKHSWVVGGIYTLECAFTTPDDLNGFNMMSYTYHGNNDGSENYAANGELEITDLMIREESVEDDSFELYGISPSSKYPSEVRNCGDNVNFLNIYDIHSAGYSLTSNGVVITFLENGAIKLNGTSSKLFSIPIVGAYQSGNCKLNLDGKHILSGLTNGCSFLFYNGTNKIAEFANDEVKDIKQKIDYVILSVKSGVSFDNTIIYPKLEKGTVATPYSQFGQGNVNFTICNKNICTQFIKRIGINSTNGSQIANANGATTDFIKVDFSKNDTYYLSGLLNTLASFVAAYNKDREFLGRTGGSERTSLEITKNVFTAATAQVIGDIEYIRIYQYKRESNTGIIDDIDNAKVQLESSAVVTEFIEHKEQNFTFPLTKGQRLYKDSYLADDGIHHKRKQATISIKNIVTLSNGNIGGICSLTSKVYKAHNALLCSNAIFDKNKTMTEGTVYENQSNAIFVGNSTDTLETLKAKYDGGIVEYELAEEEIETYTEEQQIAYNKIKNTAKSYKGTTHIFCTDEISCEFEATYIKDLETYVKNLIATEVQANES